jgi:hypothetical protein
MIKTKIVHSENPLEHWSDITDLNDKVVLDLGCGWLFQPFQSTPEYFISRGAKQIIGLDASCGEIEQLKVKYPEHIFKCKTIQQINDLVDLFITYRPQVIKMDIEGYESLMKFITAEQFSSVEEIAVEYHNPECKKILTDKLKELGFEIFSLNQFGWFCTDINQMGIMHAKKTNI